MVADVAAVNGRFLAMATPETAAGRRREGFIN
jgi:hypothetical protein